MFYSSGQVDHILRSLCRGGGADLNNIITVVACKICHRIILNVVRDSQGNIPDMVMESINF